MKSRVGRVMRAAACMAAMLLAPAAPAFAHAADRGHVLLLPTGYYLWGGAAAVALSFLLIGFAPAFRLDRLFRKRLRLRTLPSRLRFAGSALCFLLLVLLLMAGVYGSRDPLSNPLPLVFWTLFWIGLTLVQAVFGDLWRWINPLYAPWRILTGLAGRPIRRKRLPRRIGYWPAFLLFLGFAWFELVYPAPDDPARLALVIALYFLANLGAAMVFGYEAWTRQGECLSVFMRMVAGTAFLDERPLGQGRRRLRLCVPGAKLAAAAHLPLSGTLYLLLALSSVSFDGLMRTFFWLGLNDVNPLAFPGRTAVIGEMTAGLVGMFVLLATAFLACVALGERLSGRPVGFAYAPGRLVWSIIPISIAYHFSHYLTALAVNGQYALAAISDPLMTGLDLFGTAGMHVRAGTVLGAEAAWTIWNLQSAAIIAGHVMAVVVAHAIAFRLYRDPARAMRSQIPLAGLMVLYTVFGLWLLSSPTGY